MPLDKPQLAHDVVGKFGWGTKGETLKKFAADIDVNAIKDCTLERRQCRRLLAGAALCHSAWVLGSRSSFHNLRYETTLHQRADPRWDFVRPGVGLALMLFVGVAVPEEISTCVAVERGGQPQEDTATRGGHFVFAV